MVRELASIPVARKTDPSTSHEAAEYMNSSGNRFTQIMRVKFALSHWPGLTANELSTYCDMDGHQCGKRLADLREIGEAETPSDGERKCRVTNRKAMTWYPVNPALAEGESEDEDVRPLFAQTYDPVYDPDYALGRRIVAESLATVGA